MNVTIFGGHQIKIFILPVYSGDGSEDVNSLNDQIASYCKEATSEDHSALITGQPCLAFSSRDGVWHRASVLNIQEEGYEVCVHE